MSGVCIHNGLCYVSGQVGDPLVDGACVQTQTQTCLDRVDALLNKAGTDKSRLLKVEIFLKDMKDFAAMNEIYDKWVVPGAKPTRACLESNLASPAMLVEVIALAAAAK